MDSSFDAKCSRLSINEKRKLVYEISKWSHGASEILQSWSRQEILQILCAEMGKERKYTGLTKQKIIEQLLKIVSEKNSGELDPGDLEQQPSAMSARRTKGLRILDHPSQLPISANNLSMITVDTDLCDSLNCKNSACKASLARGDVFCKRCSCCICHKFDDNKDPSLWLTCSSDPPFQGCSCNMSCHLECFLRHEASGIAGNEQVTELDGVFHCVSCGKANEFLSCWRKQLTIAKDTRREDILCYRLSLSQKLLAGRKLFKNLFGIVNEAVKKLEAEVGPLTGLPVKVGRGIVNRLSSGQEVQRLCASAVEVLDSMLSDMKSNQLANPISQDCKMVASNMIRFEDICPTSVTVVLGPDNALSSNVGYSLWHYKADDDKGKTEPTCTLFPPETRFFVSGLTPAAEYIFKVISFDSVKQLSTCEARLMTSSFTGSEAERSQSPATNCSTLSNPSSLEDETYVTPCSDLKENREDNCFDFYNNAEKIVSTNLPGQPAGENENPSFVSDEEHAVRNIRPGDHSDALKLEDKQASEGQFGGAMSTPDYRSSTPVKRIPYVGQDMGLPITPCRMETLEGPGRIGWSKLSLKDREIGYGKGEEPQLRILSKKRSRDEEVYAGSDASNEEFEKYVKVVRWLECNGHIEKSFRQKFLTWYSMRATIQEERVVKVFIDTLSDDPASLAEQLVDTFEDIISSRRTAAVPSGFCMKLWH
ncbi:hypothetical protein Nepgr_019803 [Nepenthes gracilis]|uniref:Fibronectin type-III domain-containing protein n=1 Tax=Nepenthes gracilis TaxID=150966 RepID=A0AAD3SVV8_NEPGR|nr:hypothetical protein Nepgr_019803 [Nepenthes gracilis]